LRVATLSAITIYPVKSCAGIALKECRISDFGFAFDRHWMVVNSDGRFLSQREFPALALVSTALDERALILNAPGMSTLVLPFLEAGVAQANVTVWADTFPAHVASDDASRWFSDYLNLPAKLVRYDEKIEREVDRRWTGPFKAVTQFSDGFPFLIIGESSLDELNARLALKGVAPLSMDRFRPNLVLTGLEAFEEDRIETLRIGHDSEGAEFRLVKKCARCSITTVDQRVGKRDPRWPSEPLKTLADYRHDAEVGGLTFGQNAIAIGAKGKLLSVGQEVRIISNR